MTTPPPADESPTDPTAAQIRYANAAYLARLDGDSNDSAEAADAVNAYVRARMSGYRPITPIDEEIA